MPKNQEGSAKAPVVFLAIIIICVAVLAVVSFSSRPQGQENQGGNQGGGQTGPSFSEDFNSATMASLQAAGWDNWSKTQMPEVLEGSTVNFHPEEISVTENGTLKADGAGGFIYSASWSDYTLTFKFKQKVSSGNFWCGLAFRADSSWTSGLWPQNSYVLQLNDTGSANKLWKIASGAWTSIASEGSSITLNDDNWHDVELEANGGSLKVYIDNQLLLSATDGTPLTSGSVGLLNCNGPVYFDDVVKSP